MGSDPNHRPTTASAARTTARSHTGLRLRLKPVAPGAGHVDGAWWPRSRDLQAELPSLLDVLADRLGDVDRVVYAVTFWGEAPARVEVGGNTLVLKGIAALDTDTVHVCGSDERRIDLLVVPPDAAAAAADHAMAQASSPDVTLLPAAILATAGVRSGSRNQPAR